MRKSHLSGIWILIVTLNNPHSHLNHSNWTGTGIQRYISYWFYFCVYVCVCLRTANNILRGDDESGGYWQLIDFGLSRRMDDMKSSQTHIKTTTLIGTYASYNPNSPKHPCQNYLTHKYLKEHSNKTPWELVHDRYLRLHCEGVWAYRHDQCILWCILSRSDHITGHHRLASLPRRSVWSPW